MKKCMADAQPLPATEEINPSKLPVPRGEHQIGAISISGPSRISSVQTSKASGRLEAVPARVLGGRIFCFALSATRAIEVSLGEQNAEAWRP